MELKKIKQIDEQYNNVLSFLTNKLSKFKKDNDIQVTHFIIDENNFLHLHFTSRTDKDYYDYVSYSKLLNI